ncbi:MAG: hypothetical protein AAB316_12170, partial [Bacteroidota bacterium]
EEHLKISTSAGRVIFTHDADFPRLHAKGIEHAGIAYSANQEDIGGIIRNLKLIFDVLEVEDMVNKLEYV